MRKRIAQIDSYVQNLSGQTAEVSLPSEINVGSSTQTEQVQSFGEVLKASMGDKIFDIDTPPVRKNVFGELSISKTSSYTKEQIMDLIDKTAQKYGVDEKLVKAVVKQESGFNPSAKSKAGALGLMQLMPETAKGLGVKDPLNPHQNVDGGVRYLKSMLDKFNGNKVLALAAYNAGPGAVSKYDGVPPYKETQNYVMKILNNYL